MIPGPRPRFTTGCLLNGRLMPPLVQNVHGAEGGRENTAGSHGARYREQWQVGRCRDRWACGRRTCGTPRCHRRLLRLMRPTAISRHLPDRLGHTHGSGGRGVSAPVPGVPPPLCPARGPPTYWEELGQAHDDRAFFQATDRRTARDRHPQALSGAGREGTTKPPDSERLRADTRKTPLQRDKAADPGNRFLGRGRPGRREQPAHEPLVSRVSVAAVPLTGLSCDHAPRQNVDHLCMLWP